MRARKRVNEFETIATGDFAQLVQRVDTMSSEMNRKGLFSARSSKVDDSLRRRGSIRRTVELLNDEIATRVQRRWLYDQSSECFRVFAFVLMSEIVPATLINQNSLQFDLEREREIHFKFQNVLEQTKNSLHFDLVCTSETFANSFDKLAKFWLPLRIRYSHFRCV